MSLLTNQQKQAVRHLTGPLLILAGAGSGKTRVIKFRNQYLLEKGIPYKNILNLTFTQKAAGEMRSRIKNACEDYIPEKKNIFTTTFHSFGLEVIRKNIKAIDYLPNFTIVGSSEQREIISNILKEKKITFDSKLINKIIEVLSKAKNNFGEVKNSSLDLDVSGVYHRYQNFLRNYNSFDFDDLLLVPYQLLKKDKELREKLQSMYRFIMVDEFQDTNVLQYELLKLLLGEEKNLVVVGDDDQSIYSWRGANIKNILNFEKDFPQAKIVALEENFRSTKNLIELANQFIKKNHNRRKKNLFSNLSSDKKITLNELLDEKAEAKFIAESIQFKKFKHNINYSSIAVLYRTKKQSNLLEATFLEDRIPYKVFGKKGFFERKEIKDIMAYGKLLVNLDDSLAFLRVINLTPERRIREKNIAFLREAVLKSDKKISEIITSDAFRKKLNQEEIKQIDYFLNLIANYQKSTGNLAEIFRKYLDDSEYFDYLNLLKEEVEVKKIKRLRIETFINLIKKTSKKKKDYTFQKFLLHLTLNLNNEEDALESPNQEVNLMTMHAAKGLEFDYVYLVGLEEDLIPYYHQETNEINEEEERRLFYVALTRAKKECFLSYALTRKIHKKTITKKPSPFLKDLPASHIIVNSQKSKNFSVDLQEESNTIAGKEKGFAMLKAMLKK